MEAILDAGRPYVVGPAVAVRERAARTSGCWRSPARTARRRPRRCWRGSSSTPSLEPGLPDRRRARRTSASRRGSPTAPFFVIEADEYDTAFFDKRSKFVHYRPRTAILNNLEYDHADIFPDLAAIETQFHHLVRMVPGSGRLVVNGGEASLARVLARGCWSEVERFGLAEVPGTGPDWTIAVDGTILLGGAPQGTLAFGAGGPAQPAERAGGDRRRAPRRRAGRARPRRAGRVPAASSAGSKCAAPSTASPSTTTSPTIRRRSRPRSTACAARSARRASSRCSSRARTR